MLTMIMTATMIATGGFGTFPPNELTRQAAQLASENLPPEIIAPVNLVLEQVAAPTLEVIERPKVPDAGAEIAKIFENLIEPVFAAAPEAPTEPAPTAEPAETVTVEKSTPASESSPSPTSETTTTATFAASPTPLPSQTVQTSFTAVPLPTWTFAFVPPSPTKAKQPPPADTPTSTITPTQTLTPTPTFGPQLIITNVSLNGGSSSISVAAGSTVTVTYDFQVMSDGCPGCITQLVTGLGTPGSHGGTCAFDGNAGVYPGVTGSENITLTMPTVEGTYNVSVLYSWQYNCADALAGYGPGGDVIGQITIVCGAGLNLQGTAVSGAWLDYSWDGIFWMSFAPGGIPDTCHIGVQNNSSSILPISFKSADGTCMPFSLPPAGGSASFSGDNLIGQCPVEFYWP